MSQDQNPTLSLTEGLRQRLLADIEAGRTIALSDRELDHPAIRQVLPALLDELSSSRSTALAGPRFRRYTLLGEIGCGGMSTVYLARDEELHRHVALKVLRPSSGDHDRAQQRALREARALAKLAHPNIVAIYEVVQEGNLTAIAMEWIDGIALSGLLHKLPKEAGKNDMAVVRACLGTSPETGPQLESTAARTFARMIRDVALAADRAHREGLLHLDIKPANILIRRDGAALLADFGVVREIDLDVTHTQTFAGTPIYAAPEQLRRDDKAFGPHTDVFGLGMTLYEMLARARPGANEGLTEMLLRVESGRIPRLSTRATVASDLENIVHKAIAVEPQHRYPSARALADDLTAFLEGLPVTAHPETCLQRMRRWVRSEPWKATLIAVLLLTVPIVAVLGTTLVLEQPRIEESKRREAREASRHHVQTAFQTLLMTGQMPATGRQELERARELAPDSDEVFACAVSDLGLCRWQQALDTISALPAPKQDGLAVRALKKRLLEQRPYFDQEEVEAIAKSRVPLDLLLAALDRILLFCDTGVEEHLELAGTILDHLFRIQSEQDPLTVGLQSWVAGSLGDEALLAKTCMGLQSLWPDDLNAQTWRIHATGIHDPDRAIALARELLASAPQNYRLASAAAHWLISRDRCQDALDLLAATPANDLQKVHRHDLITYLHARLGHADVARQMLDDAEFRDQNPHDLKLNTLEILDADAARQHHLELMASGEATVLTLHDAANFAVKQLDIDLLEAVGRCGRRQFPHHQLFRMILGRQRALVRDYRGAAKEFEEVELPRAGIDKPAHEIACVFCWARDWQSLLRLCERWQRYSTEYPVKMNYYLGIAYARLGEPTLAMQCFSRSIGLATPENQPRAEAYFEKWWLQVDADSPVSMRDPEAAGRELNRCGLLGKIEEMPWLLAIVAEVMFANG
ncbi:MAG: serine/threonine protein kinase, partial [Planctomycetes bacterium]|nr:serine/threonine protein kinase [Planctomycetota bacterium]